MSQKRYYIRDGAKTTADGVVKASCTFSIQDGKAVAREGDPVECPACGKQGVIQCIAPRLGDQSQGRQYALSEDLCV
ncbi:PAAR domain-containing protein, partial [Halobellus sp. Atlit-31R]